LTEKKTNAEHGAAARAYDCFSHRHYFGTSTRSVHLGEDAPYLVDVEAKRFEPTNLPPPLPSLSTAVDEKIAVLQQQWRERTKVQDWNDGVDRMMEEQQQEEEQEAEQGENQHVQEYRQARVGVPQIFENAPEDV
jgi:hypothetical protein